MPQVNLGKLAQSMKQCQHCLKSDSKDAPLLSCACKRSHYCSKDCQTADWKHHKEICKMTRKTRAEMYERDATSGPVTISMGANAADIESLTKKWSQCYRPLLAMTLMHALELQTSPEHISSHALLISLVPNFTANEMPKSDAEIRTAFKVDKRTVVIGTIPKVLELLPEQLHEALQLGVESVLEKSKEIKAQQGPNGIGVGIIFLVSPMCNLARLVPLGVEGPPSSLPSWNAGWKEDLIFGVDIAMKF